MTPRRVPRPTGDALRSAVALARAGLLSPPAPRPELLRLLLRAPLSGGSIGLAVAFHAATRPDAVALVDDAGALTWRELDERVNRLARVLCAAAPARSAAAFVLRNGREFVECFAASGRAGRTAVPVNTWSTARELRHIVEAQRPGVLVADREFEAAVRGSGVELDVVWVGEDGGYEEALASVPATPPSVRGAARVVTHTSGTTGMPRGAERRLSLVEGVAAVPAALGFLTKVPLRRSDRFFVASPLFHMLGQGMLTAALALGTTTVLSGRFDARAFFDVARERDVTAACLVPVMLERIVDVADAPVLPRLRVVVVSGSALPPALHHRARERLGPVIYNLYGGTEVGWATIATPEDLCRRPHSVGRPAPGMRVFAADDAGAPLPPGSVGEVFVATGVHFAGYTDGGDRKRSGRAVSLGDVGWVDDEGYLYLAGRADEMIVSGGENVHPSEVENVLAEHPDIRESAVVGEEHREYGQALHAYVVPRRPGALSEADVVAFVQERLARYKAPKRVTLLDALPRNAAGKVLKRELGRARQSLEDPGS